MHKGSSNPIGNELDAQFLAFTYTLKKQLILLKENKLLHIFDDFVVFLFGLSDDCADIGQYYLRYSGAGLWCGIIHAAIGRDFKESPEEVALQYQIALFKSFSS